MGLPSDITGDLRDALSRCRVVTVLAGNHTTKPINLTSNQILYLANGSVLSASPNFNDFPLIEPLPTFGRSRDGLSVPPYTFLRYQPFVFAYRQTNVTITGAGIIDGQGSAWWHATFHYGRPGLVEFLNCKGVTVEGVTLQNSPFWTLHLAISQDIVVRYLTINNPRNIGNTDGIDPDSASNVLIHDCDITCGDDGIAIKSGWDYPGVTQALPSMNITIRNMNFHTLNGIAIGSEMSGGVVGVIVSNVTIDSHGPALYIKTGPSRGGYVEGIMYDGVTITAATQGIAVARSYGDPNPSNPHGWAPPASQVHDLTYLHVNGSLGDGTAGVLLGASDAKLYNVVMDDVTMMAINGWLCIDIEGSATKVSPPGCLP